MPKISGETSDTPKRAPRKRAVRRTVSAEEAPVRRVRAAAAPRVKEEAAPVARKAPTRVYEEETKPKSGKKWMLVLGGFLCVVGGAAWVGFSDKGQIDVTSRINEANQNTANETATVEGGESVVVPVQNQPPAAISGIRPRTDGGGAPEPVPEPTPEENASSTDASTEEGVAAEGEGAGEGEPAPEAAPTEEVSAETPAEPETAPELTQ